MAACRFQKQDNTLDLLLSIQDVLGAPGASQKSFLEGCMKSLVYALLFHNRIPELHEAAVILGWPLVTRDVLILHSAQDLHQSATAASSCQELQ